MVADWLAAAGFGGLKPLLTACVLPPVPFLLLVILAAALLRRRPAMSRALLGIAVVGLWLGACGGAASWVERQALAEPRALGAPERLALAGQARAGTRMAIVVLGSGLDRDAPEYGAPTLTLIALSRLRYGVWLSRQTGIPLAASGGRGWAAEADAGLPSEAAVSAGIAQSEFGWPLRWQEGASRDTRENALQSVRLLGDAGVQEIVVVTSSWHMPRAIREFEAAAAARTPAPRIVAAPTGNAFPGDRIELNWIPSGEGTIRMRWVLREALAAVVDRR